MGSAAAASGDGVCRFIRVQPFVYLADFRTVDIQFQFVRQVGSKCILSGKDMIQPFNDGFRLFCQFVIKGVCRNGRLFYCFPAGIVNVRIWFRGRNMVCNINIFRMPTMMIRWRAWGIPYSSNLYKCGTTVYPPWVPAFSVRL